MKTLILLLIVFILQPACSMNDGSSARKEVQKAFELRLSGKVDEALSILENLLAQDSTIAIAHYEMARTKWYMLTGGGAVNIDDILVSINKAVGYDPANVSYAYCKATAIFLKAFISMQGESGEVAENISETCQAFENVLKLQQDYKEAMLYLVEIYGMLPSEMGGNSSKAAMYVAELEKLDDYYGAKARLAIAPEDTDPVKYWSDYLSTHDRNAGILTELGKACLMMDDPEQAEKYIDEAISLDPSKNILLLDIARYHMMQVMQNQKVADTELPLSKQYFEKFINSSPAPIVPLNAYATGWLARINKFSGNQAEAEKLDEQAKTLDPYFSKATGVPSAFLFDPPDVANHHFVSFFMFY